jgi:hypothetical protein
MAYVKKIKSTIQLDKLIFSCASTVEDNFNDAVMYYMNEFERTCITMNNTHLTIFNKQRSHYKYSYKVSYLNYEIGEIEFCPYKRGIYEYVRFAVLNPVFYNGTLHLIQNVLNDLNLEIANFSQIDIALDSYNTDNSKVLYSYIINEKYKLKINGKYVYDMDKLINDIVYFYKGSRRNPNQIKTISIKSQKEDKEFTTYNKKDEIETESHKDYILDYHAKYNPFFKHLYRNEVRLTSDAIYRYNHTRLKESKPKIQLSDLLNKEFLYTLFVEFQRKIIDVKDAQGNTMKLYPQPTFDYCEGILQPHLPEALKETQLIKNENVVEKKIVKKGNFLKSIYNKLRIKIINLFTYENNKKIIRSHQERNKKPEFRQAIKPHPSKQHQVRYVELLENH